MGGGISIVIGAVEFTLRFYNKKYFRYIGQIFIGLRQV